MSSIIEQHEEGVSRRAALRLGALGGVAAALPATTAAGKYTTLLHYSSSYYGRVLYATGQNGQGSRYYVARGRRGIYDCDSVFINAPKSSGYVYVLNGGASGLFRGVGWLNTKWWWNIGVSVRPILIGDEPFTIG